VQKTLLPEQLQVGGAGLGLLGIAARLSAAAAARTAATGGRGCSTSDGGVAFARIVVVVKTCGRSIRSTARRRRDRGIALSAR
jgi:hypothetical protein